MFWLLYFDVFENACVCTLGRKVYLELALPQRLTRNSELRKNAKRIATKTPNKTPQKHQTPCRIRKKPVSLQHHYIANNMEYLKRTADEHLSLLREPDLLMVIKGGEMAYTRPDGVKIIPLACLKD